MSFERTITRYGHGNGYTTVCYSDEDEVIVSAGYDGDIHIWKGIEDDDPSTGCTGEFIASVAFHDSKVYVGTDVNTVQMLTYPDLDRDGTKYRFTAVATAIKVNEKYVAAGSDDTNIKVYVNDQENVVDLVGHAGPILGIDITSEGWLASASGDGTVRIWDITQQKVLKTLEGFPKVKSFDLAECYVTPSFSPGDEPKHLVCTNAKQVLLYETSTWTAETTLTDASKLKGSFTVCGFSACGKFVAAGTTKGEIVVWKVTDGKRVQGKSDGDSDEPITSLCWNPNGLCQFVYADKTGQIGCVNVEAGTSGSKNTATTNLIEGMDTDNSNAPGNYNGDDDDDEDDDNCVSLEKLKNETMRNAGLDAEGNYLHDDDDSNSRPPAASVRSDAGGPSIKFCAQQKAFQPSATPLHLEHRYMVWNGVGIVRCHQTDAENAIEAEFHDASMHHGIHMSNFLSHTMASLSSSVLALAGGEQCKLVCIALGAGSREWSVSLPNCEEIVALAASEKLVAVGTDTRFVRIFSYMGNQREILSVPGPIVAMSSHQNKLMVVYHGGISEDEQVLHCMLVDAFGLTLRSRTMPLPITPRSKLSWLGYSDRGSPITMDSFGMVRAFKGNLWYPVCDSTQHSKGVSDQFFIIDVSESKQMIQAVHCRGASFPLTHPRPMVNELPMRMPMCEIETEKSQWEDDLVRSNIFDMDARDKAGQEAALKLFALACRSEIEMRARDLIEMIASPALIPLAAKYANKLGRIHLAEKLSEMMPRVMEMEREKVRETELEYVEETPSTPSMSQISVIPSSLPSPVVLAPKLIKPGSGRRNPFKKSVGSSSANGSSPNPIKHLTDSIVGLPSNNDSFGSKSLMDVSEVVASEKTAGDANILTTTGKSPSVRKPFFEWFTERKAELMSEMPEGSNPSELTSFAMKKYKQMNASGATPGSETTATNSAKRKLDEKENEGGSGNAKLAKFRVET